MPTPMLTYTEQFKVYRHDGDHHGNLKPGALLRYAQQVATEHAEAVGLTDELYAATHTAYVLAKIAMRITRTPKVDEVLTLTTQPEQQKRAVNKRITHVVDAAGAEVALIDSRWVLIDTNRRMILRTHPAEFDTSWAPEVPYELPMKMKKAPADACETVGEETATYSRCDMNGHLNNTRYADILCDALPLTAWENAAVKELLLFYHREVPQGEHFTLRRAQTAENQWYFSGDRAGLSAFEASVTLEKNKEKSEK